MLVGGPGGEIVGLDWGEESAKKGGGWSCGKSIAGY